MATVRSIHFQDLGKAHEQAEIVRASGVDMVKVVDAPGRDPFPGKRTIIREIDNNEPNMVRSGASGARVWWEHNEARMRERSWAWAFEVGCNEPTCGTPEQNQTAALYQVEWMRQARNRGFGQKLVAGVFSGGVPEPEHAPIWKDVVNACDFLAMHEYWKKAGPRDPLWYTWLTQRYRRFYDALGFTKPTMITEAGICLGDPFGWRDAKVSEEKYAQECVEYCDECERDGYIEAVFFFTCGGGDKWKRFEITPNQTRIIMESNLRTQTMPMQGIRIEPFADFNVRSLVIPETMPVIAKVRPPMLNLEKRWYTADQHPAIPDRYEGHPERCIDWNLETGGNSDLGEPLVAPFDGLVIDAADLTGTAAERSWGKTVRVMGLLKDGHLVCWRGCHMDKIGVERGQVVKCGDRIGTIGNTGTQFAHLHMDIAVDMVPPLRAHPQHHKDWFVNPVDWFLRNGVAAALMERLVRYDGE